MIKNIYNIDYVIWVNLLEMKSADRPHYFSLVSLFIYFISGLAN